MLKRLAQRIAQKHMELRYPQQPLRLQPDYGERNAADFLGEKTVQLNTGYGNLRGGPGNVDDVVADNAVQVGTGYGANLEAEEIEGFEIVDDIGLDRMSDFWKESRFSKGEEGRKQFKQWKEDNPAAAKTFDEQTEINKDVVKNRAKAMNSDDFQELDSEQKELEEKLEEIQEDKEEIVEEAGKTAHYDIIDDIGLGRTASRSELEILRDINDVYSQLSPERLYQDGERSRGSASRVEARLYKRIKKLFKELGRQVSEYDAMEELRELEGGRTAKDHEESGSYMSRQNLREMGDMADFIVDDIGNEGLDDWVEDKISQAYSKLNDVARYRGYRDSHPHDDDSSGFKFADDEIIDDLDSMDDEEIIDDMGIMADFDKESRYSRGEKGREEYAKAKKDGDVPSDFLEYEGSVTSPGEAPDPSIVEENRKELEGKEEEMGKEAHYDIIDDLEW